MANSPVNQPAKCCIACGLRYRNEVPRPSNTAEYSTDKCGVCGRNAVVTDPEQFGGLRPEWKSHGK